MLLLGSHRRRCSSVLMLLMLLVLLLLSHESLACAPGRGHYKRRSPRKLTPLVYKQHVPNVSEQTLGASGLSEGRVSRQDSNFKDLVPNYSEDVIFRDEEGTGADRLLTQRGKEKLDTLAISVMNQWPGVRLRVTESWDETGHHGSQSLHYEGRAVDITTSDRDRSKYGMLARLAVEVGFDWVYYESRSHIHCSVKSESVTRDRHGGCFSADTEVRMADGSTRRFDQLQRGDMVKAVTDDGELVDSQVILWLDRDPAEVRQFYRLTTASGRQLTVTPGHLVYVLDAATAETGHYDLASARVTFARHAIIGDYLLTTSVNGSGPHAELLASAELVTSRGVFAPLTEHGTVVAGDLLASCYAQVEDQELAHWALLPVRLYANVRQFFAHLLRQVRVPSVARTAVKSAQPSSGVHWYPRLLNTLAEYFLPRDIMYT